MRRILAITAAVGTAAALVFAARSAAPVLSTGARPAAGAPQTADAALAPRFEPNLGQTDGQVRFLSRG
jgi:hypothetical protein